MTYVKTNKDYIGNSDDIMILMNIALRHLGQTISKVVKDRTPCYLLDNSIDALHNTNNADNYKHLQDNSARDNSCKDGRT